MWPAVMHSMQAQDLSNSPRAWTHSQHAPPQIGCKACMHNHVNIRALWLCTQHQGLRHDTWTWTGNVSTTPNMGLRPPRPLDGSSNICDFNRNGSGEVDRSPQAVHRHASCGRNTTAGSAAIAHSRTCICSCICALPAATICNRLYVPFYSCVQQRWSLTRRADGLAHNGGPATSTRPNVSL